MEGVIDGRLNLEGPYSLSWMNLDGPDKFDADFGVPGVIRFIGCRLERGMKKR